MTRTEAKPAILAELLRRTLEIEAEPEPSKGFGFRPRYQWCDWSDRQEFGPSYAVSDWFGDVTESERVNILRAIGDLERDGLLIQVRQYGRKLSHLNITDAGRLEAERLTEGVQR